MRSLVSIELREFLGAFGLGYGDLKKSPPYEVEMLLEKGKKDLDADNFEVLSFAIATGVRLNHRKVYGSVRCVETGEIKTCAEWSDDYAPNKIFYLNFGKGVERFTWKGLTFEKCGKWNF